MWTLTHTNPDLVHTVTQNHTLNVQRKDHLQLNYRQIEPWERRSSKTELELNAEAVSPSFTNTLVPFRQTSISHTQGIPPRQNISYIYLTFCLSHMQTPQTELPLLLKNSGKQEHRWIGICTTFPVHFLVFVDAFGLENVSLRGRICVCIYEWEWGASERVCSFRLQIVVFRLLTDTCVRAHYHCWEKEQSKSSSEKLEDAFSVEDTTLSRYQSCGKPKKTTTIRAIWREGGGEVKRASVMGEQVGVGGHIET